MDNMDNIETQLEDVCTLFRNAKLSEAVRVFEDLVRAKARSDCREWEATEESIRLGSLFDKVMEFESEYCQDMTMEEFAAELSTVTVIRRDGSEVEWAGKASDLTGWQDDFSLQEWRITVAESLGHEDKAGECLGSERTILLRADCVDNDLVLQHEMIHAYESMLRRYESYHEYVLLKLYDKLRPKIPNLAELIRVDSHRDHQVHSILFMLKSLDLDIRLGRELGSTYSYGRPDMYSGFLKS